MKLQSDCLNCIVNMQADKYPSDCSEEQKLVYKQKMFKVLAEAKPTESAPLLIKRIADVQTELFGKSVNYTKIKRF